MKHAVESAVARRGAVFPSLLWKELGGRGDFAPLSLYHELRRLGFVPMPAGFWWRASLPDALAERFGDLIRHIDELYPDED